MKPPVDLERRVSRRLPFVIHVLALLVLTGCLSSTSTGLDGPVMRHLQRSTSGFGEAAEVRGVLHLEGDCLYVVFDEVGERYPIVWPAGTRWDAEGQAVVTRNGESLSVGDELSGGGGYHYVDDLERLAGPDAAVLAAECVDNTFGEVAVVNNSAAAIGPVRP